VLTISELDPVTRQTRPLVRAVAGSAEADTAWTADSLLVMAHQGSCSAGGARTEMKPIADPKRWLARRDAVGDQPQRRSYRTRRATSS
jgi:hypothetical protein